MIRLFRVFVPLGALTLLVSEILLISAAFVAAAYFFAAQDPTYYLFYEHGFINIIIILVSMIAAMYLQDLYSDILVKSGVVLLLQLVVTIGVAMLMQALISYLDRSLRMPLHLMVPGVGLAAGAIFCWRLLFSAYAHELVGRDHLLLVGNSQTLSAIAAHVAEHPEQGLQVAGYVDD